MSGQVPERIVQATMRLILEQYPIYAGKQGECLTDAAQECERRGWAARTSASNLIPTGKGIEESGVAGVA